MTADRQGMPALAALKAEIDKGLSDLAGGREKDFDADRVSERGRELSQTIAEVRSRFADLPPEELERLIQEAIAAARNSGSGEHRR